MIDIDEALDQYQHKVNTSPVDEYPIIWTVHYKGDKRMGAFGFPKLPNIDDVAGHVAFGSLLPFGFTDGVNVSYIFIDEAPINGTWSNRRICVSRLIALAQGVLTTHWTVPLRITDTRTVYGPPTQEPYHIPRVQAALTTLVDSRLGLATSYTFEEAWTVASMQLKELFT